MSDFGGLEIKQTNDWSNHSKIVIRSCSRDLLNALTCKIRQMSENGFGKTIYNFGSVENELRIFSKLGTGVAVLYHLLDGQDYNRLRREASIETIN